MAGAQAPTHWPAPVEEHDGPRTIADPRLAERFSPEVIEAWEGSFFALMPPDAAVRLLASGVEMTFSAGAHLHDDTTGRVRGVVAYGDCALVAEGLVRVYRQHLGRQLTLRYVGPGFAMGIPSVFAGVDETNSQALTNTRVLRIRADVIRRLASRDAQVATVLCRVLAECIYENNELLSANVFQALRDRVARHLLDLADRDDSGRITVRANPQDIADATGTVREVVTRVLKRMREEGLVIREGRIYVLPNPGALHQVASSTAQPSNTSRVTPLPLTSRR